MEQDKIKGILYIIGLWKDTIPKGYTLLERFTASNGIEEILEVLNEVFLLEEEAIKDKNSKPFVTDDYENGVRSFASRIVTQLVMYHDEFKAYDAYRKLLKQRHIAYGFYSGLNSANNQEKHQYENVQKDDEIERGLYLGLVKFYDHFYGRFSDNEEAIELLCKFYPENICLKDSTEQVVEALYSHITNAGTIEDFGHAYNGIDLIKKHIKCLPIEVIDALIKKYLLFHVIYDKFYRKQLFYIITYSCMPRQKKMEYKFTYLDSLLLANHMNNFLYRIYKVLDKNILPYYQEGGEANLADDIIPVMRYEGKVDTYAYWENQCAMHRDFVVNKESVIHIMLADNRENILVQYKNPNERSYKMVFKFAYEDWMLDTYSLKKNEEKIEKFIFKRSNEAYDFNYNNLKFSLAYLKNYRGIKEQCVDFDHKFAYDRGAVKIVEDKHEEIPYFYGEKVYSLSCIVGENGAGKTSVIDFLSETFFKLIFLIGEYKIIFDEGCVKESHYEAYNILEKGSQFLVVFHLGSEAFYLTNIENKVVEGAKPFRAEYYKSVNELSKVVYFSNMLNVNCDYLYGVSDRQTKNKTKREKLREVLKEFRQVDYSEATSFVEKSRAIEIQKKKWNDVNSQPQIKELINKDVCYQIAFLSYLNSEGLMKFFDIPQDKVFVLTSTLAGEEQSLEVGWSLDNSLGEGKQKIKNLLAFPDTKLNYFSSGEYARFTFLSKLYWFLEGYEKYSKRLEVIVGSEVFDRNKVLGKEEDALLFIDEGELYYHPEWQRKYVKILLESIRATEIQGKVQIVLTTNSPFIISDILREDITYLTQVRKELESPFGQNIHKLLRDNFFMRYTIGEYSRQVIRDITGWLCEPEEEEDSEETINSPEFYFGEMAEEKVFYEKVFALINKIGEPLYRHRLLEILNESYLGQKYEYQLLIMEKEELERKIRVMEGREE